MSAQNEFRTIYAPQVAKRFLTTFPGSPDFAFVLLSHQNIDPAVKRAFKLEREVLFYNPATESFEHSYEDDIVTPKNHHSPRSAIREIALHIEYMAQLSDKRTPLAQLAIILENFHAYKIRQLSIGNYPTSPSQIIVDLVWNPRCDTALLSCNETSPIDANVEAWFETIKKIYGAKILFQ